MMIKQTTRRQRDNGAITTPIWKAIGIALPMALLGAQNVQAAVAVTDKPNAQTPAIVLDKPIKISVDSAIIYASSFFVNSGTLTLDPVILNQTNLHVGDNWTVSSRTAFDLSYGTRIGNDFLFTYNFEPAQRNGFSLKYISFQSWGYPPEQKVLPYSAAHLLEFMGGYQNPSVSLDITADTLFDNGKGTNVTLKLYPTNPIIINGGIALSPSIQSAYNFNFLGSNGNPYVDYGLDISKLLGSTFIDFFVHQRTGMQPGTQIGILLVFPSIFNTEVNASKTVYTESIRPSGLVELKRSSESQTELGVLPDGRRITIPTLPYYDIIRGER